MNERRRGILEDDRRSSIGPARGVIVGTIGSLPTLFIVMLLNAFNYGLGIGLGATILILSSGALGGYLGWRISPKSDLFAWVFLEILFGFIVSLFVVIIF